MNILKEFFNCFFIPFYERSHTQITCRKKVTNIIPNHRSFSSYFTFTIPQKASTYTINVRNDIFWQRKNLQPLIREVWCSNVSIEQTFSAPMFQSSKHFLNLTVWHWETISFLPASGTPRYLKGIEPIASSNVHTPKVYFTFWNANHHARSSWESSN